MSPILQPGEILGQYATVTHLRMTSGPHADAVIVVARRTPGDDPSAEDLPADMRAALLEWLGVDEPKREGLRRS